MKRVIISGALLVIGGTGCFYGIHVRAAEVSSSAGSGAAAHTPFLIERFIGKPLAQTSHAKLDPPQGPPPPANEPFTMPGSGLRARRVSDYSELVGIAASQKIAANPGRGATNGYSKYSNANVTGEYVIAYGDQPWVNSLYRVADGKWIKHLTNAKGKGLGERSDLRWDTSGRPGTQTTVYYIAGKALYRQDVLEGGATEKKIYEFPVGIRHEGHMDQSADAHYRAVPLTDKTLCVFDLYAGRPLPAVLPLAMCDVSVSGRWLMVNGPHHPGFYRIADLARNDISSSVTLPTRSHGHDGWAFDAKGNEVYCYQDNKTDWFCAFNPETGRNIRIFNMAETGYHLGQHMGRIINPQCKGWLLMATYGAPQPDWVVNQMMMIEIRPVEDHPRIWRLGSTLNGSMLGDKRKNYFAEAFASIDPPGRNIYWGANWMGQSNVELYRLELPPDWPAALDPQR